jgi:hypothetical protein
MQVEMLFHIKCEKSSGMLPNTEWEAAHLATECARELALLETFVAVQKEKEESWRWQSLMSRMMSNETDPYH